MADLKPLVLPHGDEDPHSIASVFALSAPSSRHVAMLNLSKSEAGTQSTAAIFKYHRCRKKFIIVIFPYYNVTNSFKYVYL